MSGPAKSRSRMWGALLALLLGCTCPAAAHESAGAGRVPLPKMVVEKPGKCVEDEAFMRRNHMELLRHQRGETVRKGIRAEKYSLKHCIECHAGGKNHSVVGSDENFCQGCHSYVGVKLDCFECHSGKSNAGLAKADSSGAGK